MSCSPARVPREPGCGVQTVTGSRCEQARRQPPPLPKVTDVMVVLATHVEVPLAAMEAS